MPDTPVSLPRDNAIPVHSSGECQETGQHDAWTDGNEHSSTRSSIPAIDKTKRLFSSLFVPKGREATSVDSSPSPSETTPLLTTAIYPVEEPVGRAVLWKEIKTLVRYALPVFGSFVFEYSIVVSAVISIGHISTIALAAVSIGFMTANVTGLSIIQGMACALDTVLPSAWTSSQPQLVGLWTQRMAVLQLIMLIPIYVIWFNGEALLLAIRQDPEVAKYAGIYLKWASFSLPAYSFNSVSRRYFQAQGLFDVPARIVIIVAPINMLLSYLFVWGPDSIRLGFIGAPIATSISYTLIAIASLIYGVFFVERTAWHPISSRCFTSLGSLARLCVGSVGQVASEWWSWEFAGIAASLLGPTSLASQSVLITTISCIFQAPCALGIATSIRIGNLLGEKNANGAGVAANAAMIVCISIGLFLSAILVAFRTTWGYMFNSDPAVVNLVAAVLPVVAVVQLFDDFGAVISGILRARGKQSLGAMINISAYYCLGFPIGLWLMFKQHLGLPGLWWGMTIAMAWVSLLGTYLCMSTDWEKEVEKVTARLAVDKAYEQTRRDEEYIHADSNAIVRA